MLPSGFLLRDRLDYIRAQDKVLSSILSPETLMLLRSFSHVTSSHQPAPLVHPIPFCLGAFALALPFACDAPPRALTWLPCLIQLSTQTCPHQRGRLSSFSSPPLFPQSSLTQPDIKDFSPPIEAQERAGSLFCSWLFLQNLNQYPTC